MDQTFPVAHLCIQCCFEKGNGGQTAGDGPLVREQLEVSQGMQSVLQEWKAPREAFRADAKRERGRVVLGGWLLGLDCDPSNAPWFSLEILPGDMPFLFDVMVTSRCSGSDMMWPRP